MARRAFGQTVPEPPGRKVGWAIVGLGSLAINQILPAFAKCEKSRVVALVSGHPEKAKKLAARYGVDPKRIYDYQNYDTLKNNPEVEVIYVVLPNGMRRVHDARAPGRQARAERKPMANTPAECQQMIDAARKADRKLVVAYRCRYEPFSRR
jgi:predicted dehydrogenase